MKKNNKKGMLFLVLSLTLSMVIGTSMIFAADGDGTAAKITKKVSVADGITYNQDITFNLEQVANPDTTADGTAITAPAQVALDDVTVKAVKTSFGAAKDSYDDNGVLDAQIKEKIKKPGIYTYKITENALPEKVNGYGWTQNPENQEFYLHIYVSANDQGELDYQYGSTKTLEGTEKSDIEFTNDFTKKGNNPPDNPNPDNVSLEIKKTVEGKYADKKNDEFTYTLNFIKAEKPDQPITEFIGDIYNEKGEKTGTPVTWSGEAVTFKLKDGYTIKFNDVPAGTKYTVTESAAQNYVTKVKVTGFELNGRTQLTESEQTDGQTYLITEHKNAQEYVNTYNDPTATGVAQRMLPFAVLIAFAAAGIAIYTRAKKRSEV